MQNRREFFKISLLGGITAGLGGYRLAGAHQAATPESIEDAPWLAGSTARHNMPESAVAEPGTVQAIHVSPVLYPEFAVFLVHNATEESVMLQYVNGTLTVPGLDGYSREQGAYNIPSLILPPDEYCIGSLLLPEALAVGANIEFDAEVNLHTEMPNGQIGMLLTAIPPEGAFSLPEADEPWPIRYRHDAQYTPGRVASYRQVFFDDSGRICGAVKSDTRFDKSGIAQFLGRPTHEPTMNSGGTVLGEASDSWLAVWSHMPHGDQFENFEFTDVQN